MKKTVILIAVIILVCACAVGLVAFAMNSEEPNDGASDAGEVSDIVTDPTDEITEPITDKHLYRPRYHARRRAGGVL